jgi:hypothetical protein
MADGNDNKKKNDANEFWDMLAEGMAKFHEGCRRINRRFAAVYAARTREFKGPEIDSIETHRKTIEEALNAEKLNKEAVRAFVQKQIRYNYETFEQAWQQVPNSLKHSGRPRKKPL